MLLFIEAFSFCRMKSFKLFIFLFMFSACQPMEDESARVAEFETIFVNLNEAKPLYMSEYFSNIEYIHLNSPGDMPIGRIRKFLIQDALVGFFDAAKNSVWLYTHEGDFINEVVIPRGRGPGELESIEDIVLTDDGEIHALGPLKIVAYDSEGQFLDETTFNFWIYKFVYDSASEEYIGYTANALNRSMNNEHSAKTLIYFDKNGSITKSHFPIPNGREELGYMATNKFPGFKGHQLFFPHLVDTVYSLGDFGMAPRYRLDYGRHTITEDVFDRRTNYSFTPEGRIQFVEKELKANGYVDYLIFFNETNGYTHFRIFAGDDPYVVIYNKKTKKTDVGRRAFINDIDYGFVPFMYDSSDKALFSIIESNEILRHLNEIYENEPEKYKSPQMSRLVQLGQKLSDNSNPVLQILTFKTGEE